MMMAQCVEMELPAPIPVSGPSTSKLGCTNLLDKPSRCGKPKPDHSPQPVLDQSFFHWEEEIDRNGEMTA